MILLKEAYKSNRGYDYYHLISSVDMPLMTPGEMDDFFVREKERNLFFYLMVKRTGECTTDIRLS